jgi:hypothetical protein
VLLLGSATAQVCSAELRAAISPEAPPVRVATSLARTALEAIEPALPVRGRASRTWSDPNAEWLDRHGFLPRGWDESGRPTPELWAELLANLQTPYRVQPRPVSGRTDSETLFRETQEALQRAVSAVRPLAVVTTTRGRNPQIVSASVIWNWTPWPRLLIFEPNSLALDEAGEIGEALSRIGTCAWRPHAYFTTDVNTATGYYLGNREGRVRLLATDLGHRWELVPDDEEETLFAFRAESLQGATVAAIGFEGPGPSTWQTIKFLTMAQTNVGAFDLPYYLSFP